GPRHRHPHADRHRARVRGRQVLLPRVAGDPAARLGGGGSDLRAVPRRRRAPAVRARRAHPAGRTAATGGQSPTRGAGRAMIELSKLSKLYGDFVAVDGIDLVVPKGELFGFLGPNGAGKTTTLRMIAGILKPSGGTVRISGVDMTADP